MYEIYGFDIFGNLIVRKYAEDLNKAWIIKIGLLERPNIASVLFEKLDLPYDRENHHE